MSDTDHTGTRVNLSHEEGFRFRVRFGSDGGTTIVTDEPPPLGEGAGPNPLALLAAAIGQCLASSLLYCTRRAHLEVADLAAEVRATTVRNPEGRLRVGGISVRLLPTVTPEAAARMHRCLEVFESFCLVTESVRAGVDVSVAVEPRVTLPEADGAAAVPAPNGARAA
jgi:organic hydroperoxide reductase OsmC/OhrA